MPQFKDSELTAAVIRSFDETPDPRARFLLQELVKSLHDFVRKTDLSFDEWGYAIDFLTRTGQKCTPSRQEFILLSDVLGVSMLVDAVNHRERDGATETTVLGPFYVGEHKPMPHGADISADLSGDRMFVQSRVTDLKGKKFGVIRGLHELVMKAEFAKFGLTSSQDPGSDVQVFYINAPPAVPVALRNGDIDAGSAPEPFPTIAEQQGYAVRMPPPYDTPLPPSAFQRSNMVVFDTIYHPENTMMLKLARERGCKTLTGVDMFVRQAALQFKLYTGQDAPTDLMREALKRKLKPLREE